MHPSGACLRQHGGGSFSHQLTSFKTVHSSSTDIYKGGKKDNLSEIVQVLVTVLFHHTPQDPSWGFPRSRRLGGGSRRELSGLFRCGKDRAVLRRLRPLCTVRTRTPLQGLIGWESRPHNTQQARRLKRTAENALSLKKLAASDDGQGSCKTLERACTNGRGI